MTAPQPAAPSRHRPESLRDKHFRMLDVVRARPRTHVVRTVDGDPRAGYEQLVTLLAR